MYLGVQGFAPTIRVRTLRIGNVAPCVKAEEIDIS